MDDPAFSRVRKRVSACRVVVTGAAGFIGSAVCRALLDAGCHVTGIDSFDPFYARRVKEGRLVMLRRWARFTFREADVRTTPLMEKVLARADVLVHLAARAGVRASVAEPGPYIALNVRGTAAVLEAARRAGVRRVVFASSSSVYGDAAAPFVEASTALRPRSPYGATKRAGELLCRAYADQQGFRVAVLRLFSVYGPGQRPDQAVHRFAHRLVSGRPIERYGDGPLERDYTHVDDVVNGVMRAVGWTETGGARCEICNIGTGRAVTIDRLIQLIADSLGVAPVVVMAPAHDGDAARTLADLNKARTVLGYCPTVAVETGVPEFIQWFEVAYGRQSRAAS